MNITRLLEECCYPEAIEKLNEQLKQNHQSYYNLVFIYQDLGYTYGMLDEYDLKVESYQKSIKYALKLIEEQHQDSTLLYAVIARNYELLKDYEQALHYYKLYSKSIGIIDEHSDLNQKREKAKAFFSIGLMYAYLSNKELEIMAYRKAVSLREEIYAQTQDDKDLEALISIRTCMKYV